MNKKTISKILAISLMALLLISMMTVISSATTTSVTNPNWNTIGTTGGVTDGIVSATDKLGNTAVYVIRLVGNFIAIGFLIWLGIKWIMASAQDKADLKKNMWAYVIGAVLIFGAANIIPWIVKFAAKL